MRTEKGSANMPSSIAAMIQLCSRVATPARIANSV
jgi:hypothetical protein